jgi:hypothetical protein
VAKRVKIPADVPLNKIESCPACGRAYGGD